MGQRRKRVKQKSPEWKDFEASVESVYKCLGFATQRDVEIAGRQVDIFVEKVVQGVGRTRIAVECKYTSSADSISREEVTEFLQFAETVRQQGKITQGILVTNTQYTRFAKETVSGSTAVNLISLRELEDQIFDLRDSYQGFASEYEARRIFSSYIKPSGTFCSGFEQRAFSHVDDVESKIAGWIDDSSVGLIAVLGDFGAGKTTLLERLKYHYAKRYLSNESVRRPLLVLLKEHYKYDPIGIEETAGTPIQLPYWLMSADEFRRLVIGKTEEEATSQNNIVYKALTYARMVAANLVEPAPSSYGGATPTDGLRQCSDSLLLYVLQYDVLELAREAADAWRAVSLPELRARLKLEPEWVNGEYKQRFGVKIRSRCQNCWALAVTGDSAEGLRTLTNRLAASPEYKRLMI